ncbi:MAG: serine/threonine protein kinase, partial [Planctomycetes bacterium]|nr:serine/threonine protein kinase [Planctomycetota bacterium]
MLASTATGGELAKTVDTQVGSVATDSVAEQPAAAAPNADKQTLPEKFGRYRIEKQLGTGAMGIVYLARDTQLDRQVALKTPTFDTGRDPQMIERFYREAQSAATLRHANICPVHDVGEIDGVHYISMAYIDGKPLSDFVAAEKKLPVRTVVSLVRKLALALDHAHRQGVIHRDLKPANIMIDRQKEPLIMDFGLARRIDTDEQTRLTQEGMILGTPAYMSAEQIEGDRTAGPSCDIHALGVILFELLTGELPYQGTIAAVIGQIMTQDAPPPSEFRDGVAPEIDAVCRKMMARKGEERYASMKEVAAALTAYLKSSPAAASSRAAAPPQTVTADEGLAAFLATAAEDEFPALPPRRRRRRRRQRQSMLPQLVSPWKNLPPRTKAIATTVAASLLLLMAVVFMIRTPDGTLRVEVTGEDVEVLVDGTTIELTDGQWSGERKAREHRL